MPNATNCRPSSRKQILDFIATSDQPAGKREIGAPSGCPVRKDRTQGLLRTWRTKG